MSFLSGLKKAYESIEGEFSRTFDSSQTVDETDGENSSEKKDGAPLSGGKEASPARREQSPERIEEKEGGEGKDNWGEWEEQDREETHQSKQPREKKLSNDPVSKDSYLSHQHPPPPPSSGDGSKEVSSPSTHPPSTTTSDGASTVPPSPLATSTPGKTGGKLDSLPRGELVKYIKKQAQLLQKTKARCDELANELKRKTTPSSEAVLLEELQVVRSERDRAIADQRSLQQNITSLQQDKQGLSDEIEAIEKTVKQLRSSDEDWGCKMEVASTQLSAQRNEQDRIKALFEERLRSLEDELAVAKEKLDMEGGARGKDDREMAGRGEEIERLKEELEKVSEEKNSQRSELFSEREKTKKARDEVERVTSEMEVLQEHHKCIQSQLESLQTTHQHLNTQFESLKKERDMSQKYDLICKEVDDLRTSCEAQRQQLDMARETQQTIEKERDSVQEERNVLLKETEDVRLVHESLQEEYDLMKKSQEALQKEKDILHSEWDGLQREMEEHRAAKETIQRDCDQMKETWLIERDSLLERVKEAEKQTADAEKKLLEVNTEGDGAKLQDTPVHSNSDNITEELERKIESLESKLTNITSENDTLQKSKDEAASELESVHSQLEETRERLEEREKEIECLKKEHCEERERQVSSHRDETKKLKTYIVKMKKELTDLKGKMSSPSEEEMELKRVKEEMNGVCSDRDNLQSDLATAMEELSVVRSELSTAHSDLATFQTQVGGAQRAAETAEKGAVSLREELVKERESHAANKQKLTAAVKEAKVSSVMNLELADYQRSLQTLEEKLTATQAELEQAKEENKKQLEKMDILKKEKDLQTQQSITVDDRLSKTKALWMKTKKELDTARKTEGQLQTTISSLNGQLEREKQLAEQNKVEMSTLTAKLQSMQHQSDSSVGVLQKTVRSLEHKLSASHNELTTTQLSLSQCQQDYNNYKVRVHSVLKQKSSAPSPAEISTEIRQKFETEIIQLKADLQDSNSQLSSVLAELEEISEEHNQLSTRHKQLLNDSQIELNTLKKRLEEEKSSHNRESQEQMAVIGQLRQEVIEVTEAFRGQLHSLQEEQRKVVSSLQLELEANKNTVSRLQQDVDAKVLARAVSHHPDRSQTHGIKSHDSIPIEQRSSGEGMDQSELDSNPGFPQTPLSREDSQLSFERLLSVADSEVQPSSSYSLNNKPLLRHSSVNSPGGGHHGDREEIVQLRNELTKATKTIEGLNELLRESEGATVRLGDQAKLLKEEIRRLERNKEREEAVSNMEYLKNIVLKFLHSEDSDEQTALIPVITQLLRLSPQEMKFLQDTIKGTPASLPDASSSLPSPSTHQGLAGYVHRWTGY